MSVWGTNRITVTAGGKNYLRSLPLSKLRMYANAYNIKIDHAVEKDDVIEAVMSARVGRAELVCKSRCSCDIRAQMPACRPKMKYVIVFPPSTHLSIDDISSEIL